MTSEIQCHRHGYWRAWPLEEQKAVEKFLHAVWSEALNEPPDASSYSDLESWICAIAQCEDDLGTYLLDWIQNESLSATLALSSFLICTNLLNRNGKERNAFLEAREEQYSQLQAWARSGAVTEKLSLAEIRYSNEDFAEEFARAKDLSQTIP